MRVEYNGTMYVALYAGKHGTGDTHMSAISDVISKL